MVTTQGFVLHTVPYGDTSVIAKVFTRELGVCSYIVKGVRGGRSKVKQNLLQPLSHLDMVVYDSTKHDINYIKEMTPVMRPMAALAATGAPQALSFFICEALYKSLRDNEPQKELFDYITHLLDNISQERISLAHYPVLFLIQMTYFDGILPVNNYDMRYKYFNVDKGCFEIEDPTRPQINERLSNLLHVYLQEYQERGKQDAINMHSVALKERLALMDLLIAYMQHHLAGFKNFKSHEILHAVLN